MVKCFALFSGGLDSSLAIAHMKSLGIEVIALNFVSHFFGGGGAKLEAMAKQLNVPVLFIDFKEHQFELTVKAEHGRGKNFNACIDCHAKMVHIAGTLMKKYGVDFIITGEVLGQRPMSQNAGALQTVAQLSGFPQYLIRPLCGKLLPEVEANKFVPKEKLLDINGRSTARQTQLATEYKIVEYPSHAGGCQLTEPQFGDKMKVLEKDGVLTEEFQFVFPLMRNGRFLRFREKQYAVVGRNEIENQHLIEKGINFCSYLTSITPITKQGQQLPGPAVLLLDFTQIELTQLTHKEIVLTNSDMEDLKPGECTKCNELESFKPKNVFVKASSEMLDFGLKAFSKFCKGKGKVKSEVEVYLDKDQKQPDYAIAPELDEETIKSFDKYMINK